MDCLVELMFDGIPPYHFQTVLIEANRCDVGFGFYPKHCGVSHGCEAMDVSLTITSYLEVIQKVSTLCGWGPKSTCSQERPASGGISDVPGRGRDWFWPQPGALASSLWRSQTA